MPQPSKTCEERYQRMLSQGVSEKMARMLADRKPPSVVTDDTMFAGQKNQEQLASPRVRQYADRYRRETGGGTSGKVYLSGLAREAGDPEAWVSSRAEIKDLLQRRGWSSEGQVKVKRNPDCLDTGLQEFGIDPRLVTERAAEIVAQHPELGDTPAKRERLWMECYEEMKPVYANEPTPAPPREFVDASR